MASQSECRVVGLTLQRYQTYYRFRRHMLACSNLVWHNICPVSVVECLALELSLSSGGEMYFDPAN